MFELIDTKDKFQVLYDKVSQFAGESLYTDIESTGLDWLSDNILLFQIMIGGQIYLVDVRAMGYDTLKSLLLLIKTKGITCVFHNSAFDLKFLAYRTGVLLEKIYDTMVMEAMLNAGIGKPLYSLEELAEKYAGAFMDKEARKDFINHPEDKPFSERMLQYSSVDVMVLEPIHKAQLKDIESAKMGRVAAMENDLRPVVCKMEMDGIRLDVDAWLKVEAEAIARRERLDAELKDTIVDFLVNLEAQNGFELAKKAKIPVTTKKLTKYLEEITNTQDLRGWLTERFNTRSSQQMKAILHLMQIKVKDTNEKTLQDFTSYPIVKLLLEIREVTKQIDSYGANILQHIHPKTGKIHTEYLTIGTVTGRFSSNNPNMQQIPRKGGYRECFIPDPGYLFAAVDYSQQEYRLAGAVSRDDAIIRAYANGYDMHTATAMSIFDKPKEDITSEERNFGKTLNFAILYGSTEFGLKHNLNISIEEAKEILNKFWTGYPKLSMFLSVAGERIMQLGYSSTLMGRRRYNKAKPTFANPYELNRWKERVLREGRNHIIQGGGADMLKIAMIEIFRRNPFGDNLKLCLQVHDEIVTQVHETVAEEARQFIVSIMEEVEQTFLGRIPAKADGKLKDRWSK